MTDRYAVIGHPIQHSKSPQIHAWFAGKTAQSIDYGRMDVEVDQFEPAVRTFFREGGCGLNVTVPHKESAWALCEALSPEAERAGAVNTLSLAEDGQLLGNNTDGVGLVRDITVNLKQPLSGRRILVIGAGGAVRGVLQPLLNEKPAELVLCNRTRQKAEQLAAHFSDLADIPVHPLDSLEGHFDIIINGTSASLGGDSLPVSPACFEGCQLVYDMMYGPEGTTFLKLALNQGCERAADGLGMLIEQAAESFRIWRGLRPPTADLLSHMNAWNR